MSHQGAAATERRTDRAGAPPGTFGPVKRQMVGAKKHLIGNKFPFANEVFRCARSRFFRVCPTPRNSTTFQSHRSRMAHCWFARWRSASAAPIGRSSPAPMARHRPAPNGWCSVMNLYGEVIAAPPGGRFHRGRPYRRHRATTRSGALPVLRRRRVGYVPQRPLHRARHQGASWLRLRALSDRAELCDQGRSGAGRPRRADGADQHRRQGVGSHRAHWPALPFLGAKAGAGDRCGAGWIACRNDGACSATTRSMCSTARPMGRSRNSSATSARFISPGTRSTTSSRSSLAPDIVIESHRRVIVADRRRCSAAPRRVELCALLGLGRSSRGVVRLRTVQQPDGAQQRRGVRFGQRHPPTLRVGGGGMLADADKDWLGPG